MGLRNSTLALLFELLLVMCVPGIYGVKDLREKQRDVFHGTGAVKDLPQLIKELEDKYSSLSIDKSTELSSQLAKELEDTYSSLSILSVDKNTDLSSQLVKELEDKYSSLSVLVAAKSPELSSQVAKELEDKYLGLTGL